LRKLQAVVAGTDGRQARSRDPLAIAFNRRVLIDRHLRPHVARSTFDGCLGDMMEAALRR
jgi:hypothetical protein